MILGVPGKVLEYVPPTLLRALTSITEHLDIAPTGFFSCISRKFLNRAPPNLVSDVLRSQALDFEHHWVTEDGKTPARLTGNLQVMPTVSLITRTFHAQTYLTTLMVAYPELLHRLPTPRHHSHRR
jgi:hypothetical protein